MLFRSFLPLSFAALTLSALTGCESGGVKEKSHKDIQQITTDEAFADEYFIDDLRCQDEAGASSVGSTSVHLFEGGEGKDVPFDFQGVSSVTSLGGPGFSGTYYNFEQVATCTVPGDLASCADAKVTSQPKPLKVCKQNGPYPRVSVEGIALTSLANLSKAYTYYQTIPNRSKALLNSNLLILPRVEHEFSDRTTISTDNMAYAPSFGGAPIFLIYPKGKSSVIAGRWTNVNLWEVPWGLAHEFGHHVFRTHTQIAGIGDAQGLDEAIPLQTFDLPGGRGGLDLAARTVGAGDYWNSVNEGYADLYSFYVYGAAPGLTKNLDCFEHNRDITDAVFATGEPKLLTAEMLATFTSPQTQQTASCKDPNFQDIHTIGAVVAYGINQLFSAKVGGDAGADFALAKVQLLITWAEKIGNETRAVGSANVTLDLLLQEALKTVAVGTTLTAAECAVVRTSFPLYADAWLTGPFTCPPPPGPSPIFGGGPRGLPKRQE